MEDPLYLPQVAVDLLSVCERHGLVKGENPVEWLRRKLLNQRHEESAAALRSRQNEELANLWGKLQDMLADVGRSVMSNDSGAVEIIPWLKERLCVAKFHDISCSKDLGTSKPTLIGVAGCTCRDCEMASTLLKRHAAGEHASEGLDAYVTNQRGELFQGKAALESGPGIAKLPHQQPDNSVPFLLEDLVGGDVP